MAEACASGSVAPGSDPSARPSSSRARTGRWNAAMIASAVAGMRPARPSSLRRTRQAMGWAAITSSSASITAAGPPHSPGPRPPGGPIGRRRPAPASTARRGSPPCRRSGSRASLWGSPWPRPGPRSGSGRTPGRRRGPRPARGAPPSHPAPASKPNPQSVPAVQDLSLNQPTRKGKGKSVTWASALRSYGADREAGEAPQQEAADPLGSTGGLEAPEPAKEGLGHDPGLESGQGRAEAEVDARAEGDMVGGVALGGEPVDDEAVGVGVAARVAIGGGEGDHDPASLGDRDAGDGHVTGGPAEQGLDRRVVAEGFLDRGGDQAWVVA